MALSRYTVFQSTMAAVTRLRPLARLRWFFERPIEDLAKELKEDGAGQDVALPAQRGLLQPLERDDGALEAAEFAQREGQAILPQIRTATR